MPDGLAIALIAAAALACPLMMLVSHRRGRRSPCCPPAESRSQKLARLRAEQEQLSRRIAETQGQG